MRCETEVLFHWSFSDLIWVLLFSSTNDRYWRGSIRVFPTMHGSVVQANIIDLKSSCSKYLAQLGAQLRDNWFSVPCHAIIQTREGKLDHSLYLLCTFISEQLWTGKPFSINCQQHGRGCGHDRLCPTIRFPYSLLTGTRQVKTGFPGQVVIACEDLCGFLFI